MPAIFFCYGHKLKLTNKAEQVQESRDGASRGTGLDESEREAHAAGT
ncbi:MAG: hypothetical protein M0O96_03325 [Desulforhopalus sp.]|nr:hypothetical protein [Desulforhopalus sp.]